MVSFKNPLNFIKKANRTFNVYLGNYKRIDSFLNSYERNQEKTETLLNTLLNQHEENQEKTNKFLDNYQKNQTQNKQFTEKYKHNQKKINDCIDSYNSIKEKLNRAIETFNENYDICKGYFFNGDEDTYQMMNTDDFFQMCFFNNIKLLSHSPSENRIYLETEDGIKLLTNNRFYTIKEIYARDGYSVPQLYQFKEFVVFDIGMNRGYAALKFANYDSCKTVYGFEINQETYDFALENLDLNPELAQKIKTYNFGISDKDDEIDIYCLPGSDGITTAELEFTNIQSEWLKGKEQMKIKKAKIKEASAIILDVIKNDNINSNIVLKIDTEGSEHKILDNLIDNNVLDKVDLIMGENHLGEDLDEKLVGFKNIGEKFYANNIHSFCYVKDEYFNKLPQAKFS